MDKTFTDKVSGATTNRPQLQAMLEFVREGVLSTYTASTA